ncbi:MAG TPA: hypothetical protein PKV97_00115 [Thauera aminoaromatica]|nr:hypothetical protein [Thauera aminoaromatica]
MSLGIILKADWERFGEKFQEAKAERIPQLRDLIASGKENLVRLQKQLDELPGCIETWEAELRDLSRPVQTPPLSEILALVLGRSQVVPAEVPRPIGEDAPQKISAPGGEP